MASIRDMARTMDEVVADMRAKMSPAERDEWDREMVKARADTHTMIEAQEAADLAALRRAVKLSQAVVAERRGVSQPSIAKMERQDPGTIQLGTLHQHVRALGMALDLVATAPDGRAFRIPLEDDTVDEAKVAVHG